MAAEAAGLELRVRVPLPTAALARVALGALRPDTRPPGELRSRGEVLEARWAGGTPRGLRGGVTTFLELLGLVLETIERFGPGGGAAPEPPLPHRAPDDTP